ncbi:hypothetical protein [Spirillospora sp. NPDC029432]|uniref:hypothetical protein n=1 Tax=Spirillospora sp. NPDC029432 TaxID=3154599 RepID=UPI00345437DC
MGVAGFGLEFGGGAAGGREVLQRRMAQLVEWPAVAVRVQGAGGGLEQVFGAGVGQAAAAAPFQWSITAA